MRAPKSRASRRSSHRNLKQRHGLTAPDSQRADTDESPSPTSAEKKAVEAGLAGVDEKQAAATFTETLYRTLAQLQYPQGMIPQLPLLHMPNLPGMPAWGALPQIPAVFPVLVPIQQLWGDRRARGGEEKEEDAPAAADAAQQPWLGIPSAQDWKAFWEKWMQQMNRATDVHDNPPPAYTPRETVEAEKLEKEKAHAQEQAQEPVAVAEVPSVVEPEPELLRVAAERVVVARPAEYPEVAIAEEEVQLYAYRPTRKPARRAQKKRECPSLLSQHVRY